MNDTRKTIKDSIDGLDLDNIPEETAQAVTVYLNPEEGKLVCSHGDMTPMPAWDKRWSHVLSVPTRTDGEAIADTLGSDDVLDALVATTNAYLGSEWNGSNHIGRWKETDEYASDPYGLEAAIDQDRSGWRTYWDVEQWLYESTGHKPMDVANDALAISEDFAKVAETWAADETEGMVDVGELEGAINDAYEEALGSECDHCGTKAELRECSKCGAKAIVIDCGHYEQPSKIAADGSNLTCDSCAKAGDA